MISDAPTKYNTWEEVFESEFALDKQFKNWSNHNITLRTIHDKTYSIETPELEKSDTFTRRLQALANNAIIEKEIYDHDSGKNIVFNGRGADITLRFKDGRIERRAITWSEIAKYAEERISMEKAQEQPQVASSTIPNTIPNAIPTQHGKEIVDQWLQQDNKIAEAQRQKAVDAVKSNLAKIKAEHPDGFSGKEGNITISFNEAQHGIEVRSRDRLNSDQEKALAQHGFKWSSNKQLQG